MAPLQGVSAMSVTQTVSLMTAFAQGLLSFFSPCVLPLLPVYASYLVGGVRGTDQNGEPTWPRRTILINTFFFVLGISTTLMLLGMLFTALGQFLNQHRAQVNLVCGLIVILFGLIQLGLIRRRLNRELRISLRLDKLRMNPATAFLMGLCFSFSWTPCVGPALTGVLMTVTAYATRGRGILLMIAYILGFILPFLAVGLFTGGVLRFFRKHRGFLRWSSVVSGVLLVIMGILIMTGTMGSWSSWISNAAAEESAPSAMTAPDFTLQDQFGETHTLSAYQGKVVFLNFWATWCPWCIREMPSIEELYHELEENQKDVVILGVAAPGSVDRVTEQEIIDFLEEHGWTYPVVMDRDGTYFGIYGAQSLPTTWLIRRDGTLMGYVPGAMDKATMLDVIRQTLESDTGS